MYGRGAISTAMTGSITTGSGIVMLPETSGNSLGMVLAYTAIGIGICVLLSQIIVRIVRKAHQK